MKGTYKSVLHTHTHARCSFLYLPLHYCVLQQQHVKSVQEIVQAANLYSLLIVWGNKNMWYSHETTVNELWKNYV